MTIIATIIVLGVLIFVHELGHFAAAKMVGIEVQRFSIGLGPRLWGVKRGETEYVLSAIPLGGYVKMGGMDDEVMERIEGGAPSDSPRRPSARDFDSKPLWARAFVISAGVIMNFLFAFASYTVVAGVWGFQDFATTRVAEVRAEVLPGGTEALAGIPAGARLVQVGPREVAHWHDIQQAFLELPAGPTRVVLAEPATSVEVRLPADEEARRRALGALRPWIEPEIGAVNPGSPADRGGLEGGDRILEVDGEPVRNSDEFVRAIRARPERRTELTIERDGARLVRVVTPEIASREEDPETGEQSAIGAIGVAMTFGETVSIHASATDAVRYGWRQTVGITGEILGFLGDLFTGDVSPRSMGSIVTIGQASGQAAAAGMEMFLQFMALFSVNLAILNLLPIPVLDGGHLLFLMIEAVRGRALSVEQRLRWSNVGFLIVMGIMLWALGNDFLRLLGL
jgi:regulator of sigma E protease